MQILDMPALVTRDELAKFLRIPCETLRQLLKRDEQSILKNAETKIGRRIVYSRDAIQNFLQARAGK